MMYQGAIYFAILREILRKTEDATHQKKNFRKNAEQKEMAKHFI